MKAGDGSPRTIISYGTVGGGAFVEVLHCIRYPKQGVAASQHQAGEEQSRGKKDTVHRGHPLLSRRRDRAGQGAGVPAAADTAVGRGSLCGRFAVRSIISLLVTLHPPATSLKVKLTLLSFFNDMKYAVPPSPLR